jgi:uncharacterized protein (UPF0335 family)
MSNFSTGVETVIKRMETNPEEFFNEADKWRFIFKEKFREVLTEREKSAIHEALTAVRRKEFDYNVMQTILNHEVQDQMKGYAQGAISGAYTNTVTTGTGAYLTSASGINQIQPKQEGGPVRSLGLFK